MGLLFYDYVDYPVVVGEFYNTVGQGGLNLIRRYTDWRKTWSIIIPGNFGGGTGFTDLLFYDPTEGGGEFISTDGQGGLNLIRRYTDWRKTWSIIIPGNFGGGTGFTDLLFYDSKYSPDSSVGGDEFISIDGQGNLRQFAKHNQSPYVTYIVPGNFGGGTGFTDLFFFYTLAPEGEFYSTDGQGNLHLLQSPLIIGGPNWVTREWGPFIRPL